MDQQLDVAAALQSPAAAEELDMALRLAFWRDSRCITMRHEVLDVAKDVKTVDVAALERALDDGRARGPMWTAYLDTRDDVQGSPHFFLADGSDVHNPGVRMHQEGEPGAGFLVLDDDDPAVYEDLVRRAAGRTG